MIPDNILFIKGGVYEDVKKALRQWIDLYSNDLEEDITFELIKNGRGNHIIKADARLDNDMFYYLVNYIHSPERMDYNVDVEGFTTGKSDGALKGLQLLVYISLNDKEGDNVFVTTTENKNYKIDFNGRVSEVKEKRLFRMPAEQNFFQSEFLKVNNNGKSQSVLKELEKAVAKRFKIIFPIALAAFILNVFIPYFLNDYEKMELTTWFLFSGIGMWFFIDYEMLRFDKYFFRCILIAVGVICYQYMIIRFIHPDSHACPLVASPLIFLFIQRPLRQLYILIFKREPKIERHGGEFADKIYSMILFVGLFSSVFIYGWLQEY